MASPETAIGELANHVIHAAGLQHDSDCPDELRDALNAIAEHESREEARLLVARRLGEVTSPTGAGFLAVWLGAGAEGGADPDLTGDAILGSLLRWAGSVASLPDEDADDDEPDVDAKIFAGLEMLGQGLVAHIARSPTLLQQMANDPDVVAELERVEYASAGPMWVLELLRKRSGTLLVIHVEQRRAVQVSYQNLSNCFHLFTLLQSALSAVNMPGAKRVSARLLAVARGDGMMDCHDEAWWHYGVGTCPAADLGGSVWGEANPDSIPKIDGQQVILLWPMIIKSRQWGVGFFRPLLQASPPDVTVIAELTVDEVKQWVEKLRLPEIIPEPWWKFW